MSRKMGYHVSFLIHTERERKLFGCLLKLIVCFVPIWTYDYTTGKKSCG
jgi:hypothetical protein